MFKISLIFLFITHLFSQEEYSLGSGTQLGELPLYLGGYFSLDYKYVDEGKRYRIDDVALLIYGNSNQFSYVAELEFKELYVLSNTNNAPSTQHDTNLYIERVYIDYNFNENYLFSLGKYHSPIGFWNLLPINVLRETTSNPKSSTLLFPKFTTGIYTSYTDFQTSEIKLDIMFQNMQSTSADYNNYKIKVHYGIGLSYTKDDYSLKLNSGYFKEKELNNTHSYALLSTQYNQEKYQIMSELGIQNTNGSFSYSYATYLQGLYRFTPQHIGTLRVESYHDKILNIHDNFSVFAYTYRPLYPIAIKAEYQLHSLQAQNQFLFSFSVLF